jgi:hypothetical protein
MRAMLIAQSLGEYGGAGGGIAAGLASTVTNGINWVELSLREDRNLWIAAVVCVLLGMWLFKRR